MNATSPQIRLALPSKGRMEEETLRFLEECGLPVSKTNPRQYRAGIPALPEILVIFQRPRDIPRSVSAGDIDLGITGYDAIVEGLADLDRIIVIHEALEYGACSLVVAVPMEWKDVGSVRELGARSLTQRLRIATKYPNTVGRFLRQHGLHKIEMVGADGALESAPAIGYAELIADITSTGTTLQDNRLKPLADGVIVESQAMLIGNRQALRKDEQVRSIARQMLEFVEAHMRARGQYLVFANIRGQSEAEIAALIAGQPDLEGLQGPTIAPILSISGRGGWWAINLVISSARLYPAIEEIRAIGGSGVVVTPARYIFEERPARYERSLLDLRMAQESNP